MIKIYQPLLLSLLLLLSLIACSESPNPNSIPENKAALEEIKKEPKVKEALLTDADVLYISVDDDGTKRDGYASYICEVLREHKSTTKWVKVVKFSSSNDANADNAYGILLGESNCD